MSAVAVERLERAWPEERGLLAALTTVDHKRIGIRYMITGSLFFAAAGVLALVMRTQLAVPENGGVSSEAFNELFTLHGVTMIFFFVTPVLSGFGNYLVPLMLGARDMAFPRLNAFSFWVYLAAGLFLVVASLAGARPSAGWFNYVPLSGEAYSPGRGIDVYAIGLTLLSISTTAGGINFIVTILRMRAPGMSITRMPLFCWAVLGTSFAIVFALPALTAANLLLELQRTLGWPVYAIGGGGDPLLWQHLFWIFGHPDVYIIFLPAVGIVSSIVPVFARHRMVAYEWVALATAVTAFLGFGVWVHHMFATGLPQNALTFFAAASLVIAIPSGIQVAAWITTLWRGRPVLRASSLYVIGFVITFVIGGVTGVMFAAIPFDQQATDSYFVVAHFHYVLFGGAVFPILAGLFHWIPKMSGRLLSERLGKASFWLVFTGFNVTFFPMHVLGLLGMPRRVYTYPHDAGWGTLNLVSSIGSVVLAAGLLTVLVAIVRGVRSGPPAGDDPWGGDTLEWRTSSPPPPYNFAAVPVVRSAHPAWDDAAGLDVLPGHRALETSSLRADDAEPLPMPHESWWPLALAGLLGAVAVCALLELWVVAAVLVVAAFGAVGGWHLREAHPGVRVTGRLGMIGLLATEATLLLCLVSADLYLRLRADAGPWPPAGTPAPKLTLALVLTGLIAVTTTLALLGSRLGRPAVLGALVTAVAACVVQGFELANAVGDAHPADSAYGAMFAILAGAHAAHLVAGVPLLAWIAVRPRLAWLAGAYWSFLSLLWIVVLATLYLSVR